MRFARNQRDERRKHGKHCKSTHGVVLLGV